MDLLDGIAFGGFNVLDLPRLARTLRRPCVSVMRKLPDLPAMERLGDIPLKGKEAPVEVYAVAF